MNITLHIEATTPAQLQEAILELARLSTYNTPSQQPGPEKTKRGNKAITTIEKSANPEQEITSEDPVTPTTKEENPEITIEEAEGEEKIPTIVELRAKAQEKGTTPEGKKAIKALLDEFGSKSISDVEESKRLKFLRRLEAL